MARDQTPTITIRLEVLGPLVVTREPGAEVELPSSMRALHLLVLFALAPSYEKQQLFNYLWPPGEDLNHYDEGERNRIRNKIDTELANARRSVDLGPRSGFLGSKAPLVIERTRSSAIRVTSDIDEFYDLAKVTRTPADWQTALSLVRGEVAEYLPTGSQINVTWLQRERERLRGEITAILKRLHPDLTAEELDEACRDVLAGKNATADDDSGRGSAGADYIDAPTVDRSTPGQFTAIPADTDDMPVMIRESDNSAGSRPRRPRRRHYLAYFVCLAGFTGAAIGLLLSGPSHRTLIPPEGAIVNAETGRYSFHVPIKPAQRPAQIQGGSIFRACDLTHEPQCSHPTTLIHARRGDELELILELYDPASSPVPYVKVKASSEYFYPVMPDTPLTDDLTMAITVQWPEAKIPGTTSVAEPASVGQLRRGSPAIPPINVKLPAAEPYAFYYLPNVTRLLYGRWSTGEHEIRLPNGVATEGIVLQDVGPPTSCFSCAEDYRRRLVFYVEIGPISLHELQLKQSKHA